jgi:hypothetical protein
VGSDLAQLVPRNPLGIDPGPYAQLVLVPTGHKTKQLHDQAGRPALQDVIHLLSVVLEKFYQKSCQRVEVAPKIPPPSILQDEILHSAQLRAVLKPIEGCLAAFGTATDDPSG